MVISPKDMEAWPDSGPIAASIRVVRLSVEKTRRNVSAGAAWGSKETIRASG